MNEIKVNMVKFLMTMFETSSDNSTAVRQFKLNVDELVRRNQIPNSVRNLIYNMYGIANTDTFKPNAQANKLMQINMLMMQLENVLRSGNKNNIEVFKKNIENGVKQGSILKSAADIVFDIYDIQNVTISSKSNIPILEPVIDVPTSSMNVNNNKKADKPKDKNKDVQIDIAQFKSQFVPEIYYEYENPNYDGCSGSSRDLHVKLIDAKSRPAGAKFVIHKLLHDDGCHCSYGFVPVPKEYYKPAPSTRINTPTTGSAIGCTGGGYSMRNC